ncbi:hypothetical protein ID866_10127 [Astraeus odoratus]|nr:hypothetical protein ID866_10127 [Astraeus odoratus]
MLVNWEFAETLFDLYIPQPTEISQTTSDPNVTVTSGITSSNFVFLHFAYSELRNVATDANPSGSARRTALFSDQKYNPSLWGTLVRQSLLLLGQDYQTLLRRGEPAPPVPSAPVSTPSTPKPPNPPPSTPILRQPIYKPPQESPLSRILNTFASDSELSKATDEVAAEVEAIAKDVQVPELFRSVASTATSAIPSSTAVAIQKPAATTSAFTTRLQQEYGGLLVRYAPVYLRDVMSRVNEWWTRERIHKRAEISLPRRELDVLIIDSLSALVCASLAEDRYGVVQRDIPRILEALLSFLAAVEDYQNEVRVLYVPPTPDELTGGNRKMLHEKERTRVEVAKASEVLSVVGDALKSGISDIVRTFGDKLSAFKFPPKTAKKLQGFVDYI